MFNGLWQLYDIFIFTYTLKISLSIIIYRKDINISTINLVCINNKLIVKLSVNYCTSTQPFETKYNLLLFNISD